MRLLETRMITKQEFAFLVAVFSAAGQDLVKFGITPDSLVASLQDGGMGSFRFICAGIAESARRKKQALIEGDFRDEDNMFVSFSVDLDKEGQIFELDMWRVDDAPLQRFPSTAEEINISSEK